MFCLLVNVVIVGVAAVVREGVSCRSYCVRLYCLHCLAVASCV